MPEWIMSPSDVALYNSFPKFLWLLWTKYLDLPRPTRVQYNIAEYLQHGPAKRMIQAFRGVGKSWITCAYAVWRLWRNPQLRILIVSANEKKASENAIFIKQLIEMVDILTPLRGGSRDSMLNFDVGPATASPSPSVRCDGIMGQITGARADIIIADDVEVPKNSETEKMREKLEERTKEFASIKKPEIKGREGTKSEVIYLGTPQSQESIYRNLPGKGYDVCIWPSRYPSEANRINYGDHLAPLLARELDDNPSLGISVGSTLGGAATDPERFDDLDLIDREAEYKAAGFTLQFMLDTRLSDAEKYPLKLSDLMVMDVDPEMAPVKLTWARGREQRLEGLPNLGFDGDRFHGPMYVSKDHYEKYDGSVMFVDPSGRGKDETAYAVTKMLHGMIYVVDVGGLPGGYDEATLIKLANVAKHHQVNEVWAEGNFGDGMFLQIFEPVLKRIYPVTLEEYKVSGQKEARMLDKLEPVVQSHRLVIDRALIERDAGGDVGRDYKLMYQFTHLTRDRGSLKHDDRLDALAEAVGYWVEQMDRDVHNAEEEAIEKLRQERIEVFLSRASHGYRRRGLNLVGR
jgi:hypothetical protein